MVVSSLLSSALLVSSRDSTISDLYSSSLREPMNIYLSLSALCNVSHFSEKQNSSSLLLSYIHSILLPLFCPLLLTRKSNDRTFDDVKSSGEKFLLSLSLSPIYPSLSLYLSPVCASVASHSLFGAERSPFCSREHIASITSATRALHSMGPLILIKEQQKALETVASTCPCSITHSHITVAASHRIALHHALHSQ